MKTKKIEQILTYFSVLIFGLVVFCIPSFSYANRYPFIFYILTSVLFVTFIIKIIFKRKFIINPLSLLYLLFLVVGIISTALSLFNDFAIGPILNTLVLVTIFLVLSNEEKEIISLFMISAFVGIVIFGFYFLIVYHNQLFNSNLNRLGGYFGDINDISMILCVGASIGVGYFSYVKKTYIKVIALISSLFLIFLSLTCGSKIAILIIAGILILFIFVLFQKSPIWVPLLISLSGIFVLILLIQLPIFSVIKERILGDLFFVFNGNVDSARSSIERFDMFVNGFLLFLKRPLLGFGFNGFSVYSSFGGGWSHNHISESLCNYGLLGSTLFHIPLICFLSNVFKKKSNPLFFMPAIVFCISMISIPLFTEKIFSYLFAVALASTNYSYFDRIIFEKRNDKTMKITMIGAKRLPSRNGGIDVVVTTLSTGLVKKGHKVMAYIRRRKQKIEKEFEGVRIKEVFTINKKSTDALLYSFFSTIRGIFSKADVLHFHAEGNTYFLWLTKFSRKKIIVTIHGLDWKRSKFKGFGQKILIKSEKRIVKYADQIITLCKNDYEYFLKTYNRTTHLIPNGFVKEKLLEPNIIRNKYGLIKDGYLLFLARIVPEKGLHYLLEAFKQTTIDKKLIIAGDDKHSKDYFDEMKKLANGDERIIFTGFVSGDELHELFSNAYLYILPSDIEGMPISLLEALGHKRICLLSNIPENHVDDTNSYYFEKANVDDLRQKLIIIDKNKKEYVDSTLPSWSDVIDETLKVYKM